MHADKHARFVVLLMCLNEASIPPTASDEYVDPQSSLPASPGAQTSETHAKHMCRRRRLTRMPRQLLDVSQLHLRQSESIRDGCPVCSKAHRARFGDPAIAWSSASLGHIS